MFQNRMETEQQEQQSKIDKEQREQQSKNDKEDRDWDYQLCREGLALQREENRAQQNMMNMMMMAMLGGQQQWPPAAIPHTSVTFPHMPVINCDDDVSIGSMADKDPPGNPGNGG